MARAHPKKSVADINSKSFKGENTKKPCPEDTKFPCSPRLITLDLCTVRRAINKIAGTLCKPDYEQLMTAHTKDSVDISLETLQRLAQLSCRLSCLDRRGTDCLINCSIEELMKAYLDFNHDLIKLLITKSNDTMDIIDKNLTECQKEEDEEEDEDEEKPGAKIDIQ
jgi:DNA-binding FrmR family transcriptional regulator